MISITSPDDPRLDDYRLLRSPERLAARGLFVAEGRLVVRSLLTSTRFRAVSVLVTATAAASLADVLDGATTPVLVAPQDVMSHVAGFDIHRGCVALAARPARPALDSLSLATLRLLVVLEGVNNPDNIGGIFRSAAAFGADAVVLGPDCGDPLYRKAVRTSMAASLAVPFVDAGVWPQSLAVLRDHGFEVLALTTGSGASALRDIRVPSRVALLVGAEGYGLTADATAAADQMVRIPMTGAVDSLNVAVATSIALYAVTTTQTVVPGHP